MNFLKLALPMQQILSPSKPLSHHAQGRDIQQKQRIQESKQSYAKKRNAIKQNTRLPRSIPQRQVLSQT
jgi:hypothetical protein